MTEPEIPTASFEDRAGEVLFHALGGRHHWGKIQQQPRQWKVCIPGDISTFDSNILTKIVLGAHKYCIRVELCNGGPMRQGFILSDRKREGDTYTRHPTIQQAIEAYEK